MILTRLSTRGVSKLSEWQAAETADNTAETTEAVEEQVTEDNLEPEQDNAKSEIRYRKRAQAAEASLETAQTTIAELQSTIVAMVAEKAGINPKVLDLTEQAWVTETGNIDQDALQAALAETASMVGIKPIRKPAPVATLGTQSSPGGGTLTLADAYRHATSS